MHISVHYSFINLKPTNRQFCELQHSNLSKVTLDTSFLDEDRLCEKVQEEKEKKMTPRKKRVKRSDFSLKIKIDARKIANL